ncbi:MAG: dTDP-4-dehydrorhamnose 3,5-epimerase [Pedosphaera sp.]|nr:dTDP-4-dehydrorhamnose 3,5-epimerase [Pedosphaera sp.]
MSTHLKLLPAELEGVFVVQPKIFTDKRGVFVKTYHEELFREAGIAFTPREEFFSTSRKGVVRGMHFQLPPAAHDKLVFCPTGKVLDVVVDLRKESKTFGKTFTRELSAENRELLFIPVGFAHGFLSLADDTIMVYQTSTVHSPAQDAGILWSSVGFDWPVKEPILSDRDKTFPALKDFQSPF